MDMLTSEQKAAMIRDFCPMDSEGFRAFFSGDGWDCLELLLRIVIGRDIRVTEVRTKERLGGIFGHGAIPGILACDSEGRYYDIELQARPEGASRERARFYSSMMDTHLLPKGADYPDLPDTYVIFITHDDVLGMGRPSYTIARTIEEAGEPFGDGSWIVYVNRKMAEGGTALERLMHDMTCADQGGNAL